MLYTILKAIPILTAAVVLTVCCVQDLKNKEFSLWLALVLFAIASAGAAMNESLISNLIAAAAVFAALGAVSLISKQKLGMGDVLVMSALVLMRGLASGVFIFNTALVLCLVFCTFRLGLSKDKKNKETAFIPFISIGFVLSFI